MLFRFSKLDVLDNGEYDYENPKYLGSCDHKDYTEFNKLLHFMKEQNEPFKAVGNINLVKEGENGKGQLEDGNVESAYDIIDIILRIPLDKINLECIEVYVSPSY